MIRAVWGFLTRNVEPLAQTWGDEDHSQGGFNFHPVFIPLNQLLGAILGFGFWIADLLYRCALSVFIKLTEYLKFKIPNL